MKAWREIYEGMEADANIKKLMQDKSVDSETKSRLYKSADEASAKAIDAQIKKIAGTGATKISTEDAWHLKLLRNMLKRK